MKKQINLSLKRLNPQLFFTMITCLFIVGSCKKEQINEQANNEINWARDYYNTSLNSIRPKSISSGPDQQSGSKTGQNGQNKRTPLWQLSSAGESEGIAFVEVPLDYSHRMGSAVKLPGLSLTQEQRIRMATASFDILLIYKNKNDVVKEQVVTLMPDLAYVERHNGDISGNRLAHLESDFSGYLVYTGWKGEKMFFERIEDGLLVKTGGMGERIMKRLAKAPAKSSREAVMRATMEGDENCITIEYDTYWIECWQTVSETSCTATWIGEGSNTYCSSGGGNIIEDTSPPKEIKDSLLNKCMKNVMNIIITQNGAVNALLRNFTGNSTFSPNYNWTLKNKELSDTELAKTGNWDRINKNVTTEIDDVKFTNASDLAIAKTLLHEGIHAYLVAYFGSDPMNANKEYSVLFDEYMKIKRPDLNEIHHNEMARLFVSQIAISLKDFGDSQGYVFSSSLEKERFYDDLAWGGLFESKAFKALAPDVQGRIKNVISIEQKGQDTLGTTKAQKGKTGGCL